MLFQRVCRVRSQHMHGLEQEVDMPVVVASWNIIFSAPLRCDGAISERYTGTACIATYLLSTHMSRTSTCPAVPHMHA